MNPGKVKFARDGGRTGGLDGAGGGAASATDTLTIEAFSKETFPRSSCMNRNTQSRRRCQCNKVF